MFEKMFAPKATKKEDASTPISQSSEQAPIEKAEKGSKIKNMLKIVSLATLGLASLEAGAQTKQETRTPEAAKKIIDLGNQRQDLVKSIKIGAEINLGDKNTINHALQKLIVHGHELVYRSSNETLENGKIIRHDLMMIDNNGDGAPDIMLGKDLENPMATIPVSEDKGTGTLTYADGSMGSSTMGSPERRSAEDLKASQDSKFELNADDILTGINHGAGAEDNAKAEIINNYGFDVMVMSELTPEEQAEAQAGFNQVLQKAAEKLAQNQ
jgi:hypothetical protein